MAAISIVLVLLFDWNHFCFFCFFMYLNTELLKLCHHDLITVRFLGDCAFLNRASKFALTLSFSCFSLDRIGLSLK